MRFRDRAVAGEALGGELRGLDLPAPVVLGLPRGGVVVAAEVAAALGAPLDVLVVRKLGVPWHPELGMGAIAEGGVVVLNRDVIRQAGADEDDIARVQEAEEAELARRAETYRRHRARVPLAGKTAVIVDDGLATGYTARAAVIAARREGAGRVLVAVPVGAADTVGALEQEADTVVCLYQPHWFMAVGEWYEDFRQTSDAEVIALLEAAAT